MPPQRWDCSWDVQVRPLLIRMGDGVALSPALLSQGPHPTQSQARAWTSAAGGCGVEDKPGQGREKLLRLFAPSLVVLGQDGRSVQPVPVVEMVVIVPTAAEQQTVHMHAEKAGDSTPGMVNSHGGGGFNTAPWLDHSPKAQLTVGLGCAIKVGLEGEGDIYLG